MDAACFGTAGEEAARRGGPPRRALVTGGAGFLGSHLCESLIADGYEVHALDDFSTGRAANVAGLERSGRFALFAHDVVDPVPDALPRFDEIYNLACPASPIHYQDDPVKTLRTCALGAYHAAERARQDGARLFHASTSEVYGDPEIHPQAETYHGNVNACGPRSCYDEGKRFAETMVLDHGARHGVPVRIARIFNTYGPRMRRDDGRVVSNFIVQALTGADITLYGDGSQTRSFCYVDDLIRGIRRLMASERAEGPVNLGNPAEISVGALARLVVKMTGSASRIVLLPLPIDDPRRRRPDITLARALIGWAPGVALAAGLERTIACFAARPDIAPPCAAARPAAPVAGFAAQPGKDLLHV